MAEEGFNAISRKAWAASSDDVNIGMMEAASDQKTQEDEENLKKLLSQKNNIKEDMHIFRILKKSELDDERLWVIGENELGAGLPVFVPHEKFGACLAIRGTIRELWNEPGKRELHFVVRRLHPMSVSKRNSDHQHFLIPLRCKKHGVEIPWILPVPIGLTEVRVSPNDKKKTQFTTVVWSNDSPTELTHATLEEAYRILDGALGQEKKEGMEALMAIQKHAHPELFSKYLERSVSLFKRYGGSESGEVALNGGDGPALLMQQLIGNDVSETEDEASDLIMPLALSDTSVASSQHRLAMVYVLRFAPWMRASFIKLYHFPNLDVIMRKKHEICQREARATALTKSWTVLNQVGTSAATRNAITQTFNDSFSTLGLESDDY